MKKKSPRYNTRVDALTPLEKNFCHEYPVDFNLTRSAIRAGFQGKKASASNWACMLMKKPKVSAYLSKLVEERRARTDLKADAILNKFNAITTAKLSDFFTVDDKGRLHFKTLDAIDPELMMALTFQVERKPKGPDALSISLSDKLRALAFDRLGQYHKLYGAGNLNVNLSGDDLDKVVVIASRFDASGSDVAPH